MKKLCSLCEAWEAIPCSSKGECRLKAPKCDEDGDRNFPTTFANDFCFECPNPKIVEDKIVEDKIVEDNKKMLVDIVSKNEKLLEIIDEILDIVKPYDGPITTGWE